jgi:hypothetical protein
MSYTIKTALERLKFRFSNKKIFVNEDDITALKKVIYYVNQQEENTFKTNHHLAKFIMKVYYLEYTRTGCKLIAEKEVLSTFNISLDSTLNEFIKELHHIDLSDYMDDIKGLERAIKKQDEKAEETKWKLWINYLIKNKGRLKC